MELSTTPTQTLDIPPHFNIEFISSKEEAFLTNVACFISETVNHHVEKGPGSRPGKREGNRQSGSSGYNF